MLIKLMDANVKRREKPTEIESNIKGMKSTSVVKNAKIKLTIFHKKLSSLKMKQNPRSVKLRREMNMYKSSNPQF
jgi:hypothetical protein